MFLLSMLGLTVLACWYVPHCAATCGALALAYDYCVHEIFVDGEFAEESFATDLRRWVSLRRERGLSGRELAVAGVALCLAAFAAGYWVVVADVAPRAAWEWLRYGARCFCGLIGAVSCWFLVTGLAAHVVKDKGGLTAVAAFAGGVAVLAALWFYAWHLLSVSRGLMTVYLGVYGEAEVDADKESVMKLLLVLALVMEPGAVAAAARAEFLGEGEQFGIIGPAELDWLGFVAGTWRRLFVRAVLVAWGFHGSVARIRRPRDAWFIDAGCVLAIYFGGQALMQLGSLLYALGQLEAVYAMGRALCTETVFKASKRFGARLRNESSLSTTLGYFGLVLLAAVCAWYEVVLFSKFDKAGLAVAFAINCFAIHSIFTGYWAVFDKLLPRLQASWFRACATLCVMYADAFYTDGQVTALVQCFGATFLSFRALGALTGAPHEVRARAATWEVAGAVRDGIGAVVNRALEGVNRALDARARRSPRPSRRPGPPRRRRGGRRAPARRGAARAAARAAAARGGEA